jgi:hypothetical protein
VPSNSSVPVHHFLSRSLSLFLFLFLSISISFSSYLFLSPFLPPSIPHSLTHSLSLPPRSSLRASLPSRALSLSLSLSPSLLFLWRSGFWFGNEQRQVGSWWHVRSRSQVACRHLCLSVLSFRPFTILSFRLCSVSQDGRIRTLKALSDLEGAVPPDAITGTPRMRVCVCEREREREREN